MEIVRYFAVHDCGRILNPLLVEGQMHGGIGQALTEEMAYTQDGQPTIGSLLDYALPIAAGVPEETLDTIETPSPTPTHWEPKGSARCPPWQRQWQWPTRWWTRSGPPESGT